MENSPFSLVALAALGVAVSTDFTLTISASRAEFDLRALAISNGWNGTTKVNCVINSGIVVTSSSSATPAITVAGSFPGGVTITNNGVISGMSGTGGSGGWGDAGGYQPTVGGTGGTALSTSIAVTVTNNGTICGGGGGGGGGGGSMDSTAGGPYSGGNGGAGARYGVAAAAGVAGYATMYWGATNGTGGDGGALGTAGGSGYQGVVDGGGGGVSQYGAGGGAAGKSVNGNASITWFATGTRTGPIT